jgi:hypothetical protein
LTGRLRNVNLQSNHHAEMEEEVSERGVEAKDDEEGKRGGEENGMDAGLSFGVDPLSRRRASERPPLVFRRPRREITAKRQSNQSY